MMLHQVILCLMCLSLWADKSQFLVKLDQLIASNQLQEAQNLLKSKEAESTPLPDRNARVSRILSLQADTEANEAKKIELYQKAISVASEALTSHPKHAGAYLRRAIAKGKLTLYRGILESRALVLEIKSDAEKVLELQEKSNYEKALAHYLLGRLHNKVSETPKALRMPIGLGWASPAEGEKQLETAYQTNPQSIAFAFHYAEVLAKKGRKQEAKKILESIPSLPVIDPTDLPLQTEAKNLLQSL